MDGWASCFFVHKKFAKKNTQQQHIYIYKPWDLLLGISAKRNNACRVQTSPWTNRHFHPPPVLGSGVPGATPKFRGKVCAKRGDPRGDCKGLGGLSNNSRVELWSMMPAKHTTCFTKMVEWKKQFFVHSLSQLLFHQFNAFWSSKKIIYKNDDDLDVVFLKRSCDVFFSNVVGRFDGCEVCGQDFWWLSVRHNVVISYFVRPVCFVARCLVWLHCLLRFTDASKTWCSNKFASVTFPTVASAKTAGETP